MSTPSKPSRIMIAALSLSAAGIVGLMGQEGYTDTAVIPTRGDVPTVGFGSTTRADGSKVRMGDRTTPVQAAQRTLAYTQDADTAFKRCVRVPLHQAEYDTYLDFGYQYGVPTLCASSIVRNLNAFQYAEACESLLAYRFSAGYDCSTPGNKVCSGVWTRQQKRHAACMAAQ